MDNSRIITLTLIGVISIFLVWGYASTTGVESKTITSADEYNIKTVDGEDVEGYYVFDVAVNTRDELKFNFANISKELEKDLSKDLPEGSEIRTDSTVSVIFKPHGDPYISGPVTKRGFVYDEEGSGSLLLPGEKRVWSWYSLGYPEWHIDGRHAPYDVTVKKDGETIHSDTYVSGSREGWDTGKTIDLPFDMEIQQFAQLTNGLNLPGDKYSYIWLSDSGSTWTKLVKQSELINQLQAGYEDTNTAGAVVEDIIDQWDEVSTGAGISGPDWYPSPNELEGRVGVLSEINRNVYIPPEADVDRWDESVPSLWSKEVPEYDGAKNPGTVISDPTKYTVTRALPDASVQAFLEFKVPADVFDSWIYKPPYGIPEFVGAMNPEATDGGSWLTGIQVKNTGPTGDTFVADLNPQDPKVTIQDSPGRIYIPAGETRLLQWTVRKESTSGDGTYNIDFNYDVEAIESQKSISDSYSQEIVHGDDVSDDGYGSVTGMVVNQSGDPINGALVSAGGKSDITSSDGIFNISQIVSGSQTLEVSAEGFESFDKSISIRKNQTTNMGNVVLYKGKEEGLPLVIIAIVVMVSISAVYALYESGKLYDWGIINKR